MLKATWAMTGPELARVVAENKGWRGQPSGWIYDEDNQPLTLGWAALAEMLTGVGLIVVGKGIDWPLWHHQPYRLQAFYAACEDRRRGRG